MLIWLYNWWHHYYLIKISHSWYVVLTALPHHFTRWSNNNYKQQITFYYPPMRCNDVYPQILSMSHIRTLHIHNIKSTFMYYYWQYEYMYIIIYGRLKEEWQAYSTCLCMFWQNKIYDQRRLFVCICINYVTYVHKLYKYMKILYHNISQWVISKLFIICAAYYIINGYKNCYNVFSSVC